MRKVKKKSSETSKKPYESPSNETSNQLTLNANDPIMSNINLLITTVDQQSDEELVRKHSEIFNVLKKNNYSISLAHVHQQVLITSDSDLTYLNVAFQLGIARHNFPRMLAEKTYDDGIPLYLKRLKTISLRDALKHWGIEYYLRLNKLKYTSNKYSKSVSDYSFKALHVCIRDNTTIAIVASIFGQFERHRFENFLKKYNLFWLELKLLNEEEIKKIIGDQYDEQLDAITNIDLSTATLRKIFEMLHNRVNVENILNHKHFSKPFLPEYLSQFTYNGRVIDQTLLENLNSFDEGAIKKINSGDDVVRECTVCSSDISNTTIEMTITSQVSTSVASNQQNTNIQIDCMPSTQDTFQDTAHLHITTLTNVNTSTENPNNLVTQSILNSNDPIIDFNLFITTIDLQSDDELERNHLKIINDLKKNSYRESLAYVHQLVMTISNKDLTYPNIAFRLEIDRRILPSLLAQKTYNDIPLYLNKLKTLSLRDALKAWGAEYYLSLKKGKKTFHNSIHDYSFKAIHDCIKNNNVISDVVFIFKLRNISTLEKFLTEHNLCWIELKLLKKKEIIKTIGINQYLESMSKTYDLGTTTICKIFKILHNHEDVKKDINKYNDDLLKYDGYEYLRQFTYNDERLNKSILEKLEVFDERVVKRINSCQQPLQNIIQDKRPREYAADTVNSFNQIVKNFIPTLTSEEIIKCSSDILNYLTQVKSEEMNKVSINQQTSTCLNNSLVNTDATNDHNPISNSYKDNSNFLFFSPTSSPHTDKSPIHTENEDNLLFEDEFDSIPGFFIKY